MALPAHVNGLGLVAQAMGGIGTTCAEQAAARMGGRCASPCQLSSPHLRVGLVDCAGSASERASGRLGRRQGSRQRLDDPHAPHVAPVARVGPVGVPVEVLGVGEWEGRGGRDGGGRWTHPALPRRRRHGDHRRRGEGQREAPVGLQGSSGGEGGSEQLVLPQPRSPTPPDAAPPRRRRAAAP